MQKALAKMKAGERVTIVCVGDSNTAVTFHTRGRMTWVELLSEALFEEYGPDAALVVNAGKAASGAEDTLKRLDHDVLCLNPDLVILALGMGDCKDIPLFMDRMRTIIGRIREKCGSEIMIRTPNPVVTVPGVPLPAEEPRPGYYWPNPKRPLKECAEALVALGKELDCTVVDHFTQWTAKTFHIKNSTANPCALWMRMADISHPGAQGHLAFFRELAPYFGVAKYFPWEEADEK